MRSNSNIPVQKTQLIKENIQHCQPLDNEESQQNQTISDTFNLVSSDTNYRPLQRQFN